jgi:nucleoside-diphosphate-sugar epimerase
MNPITVLGASGFIGSTVVKRLRGTGVECFAPGRDEKLPGNKLGDVIYCVGLTADFRTLPYETVQAHVCHLLHVLRDCDFRSLVYLSSTRVYEEHAALAREEDVVQVSSSDRDDLYNISKVMGESLSLACGKRIHVVRLSNVYGNDFASHNFLSTIIRDAILTKKVILQSSLDSEKDYIRVDDVADLLVKISTGGRQRIYNLASGIKVSHRDITRALADLTGCHVEVIAGAPRISQPVINIDRIKDEFGFESSSLLDDVNHLIHSYCYYYAGKGN